MPAKAIVFRNTQVNAVKKKSQTYNIKCLIFLTFSFTIKRKSRKSILNLDIHVYIGYIQYTRTNEFQCYLYTYIHIKSFYLHPKFSKKHIIPSLLVYTKYETNKTCRYKQ